MLRKPVKYTTFIHASTLLESLVALAITTLMIWLVFRTIPNTFTPVNPERKLEAFFVADSIVHTMLPAPWADAVDTLQLRGFTVEASCTAYDTLSAVKMLSVRVTVNKHVLAERKLLAPHYHEKSY